MTREKITITGPGRRPTRQAWLGVGALIICGAALIAGCSTSSTTTVTHSPSAPATSPSPAGTASVSKANCVHINSLRNSLTSLTHIKVSSSSAGQLTSDLTNIQAQLAALKGQSLGAFSAQANQLSAALDKIKKDAAELSSNPTGAAKALSADLNELKTKAGPIVTEMKMVCHVS